MILLAQSAMQRLMLRSSSRQACSHRGTASPPHPLHRPPCAPLPQGAGMLFVSGATVAYRRKQTTAFKLAYFMSWPTLGSALLWALMPDQKQMEKARWAGAAVLGIAAGWACDGRWCSAARLPPALARLRAAPFCCKLPGGK